MSSYEAGKQHLMNNLRQRDITDDRVLRAMEAVPRHHFVPTEYREHSYNLRPLPIGHDQTISTPWIVASMSQMLGLTGTERVLEIGTGCGYQTAVLCELAAEVFSIEIVEPVGQYGRSNLESLGYAPQLRIGDGNLGWPSAAPFDAALLAATAPRVPMNIVAQLKVGGVLVAPVEKGEHEVMVRCTRTADGVDVEEIYGVRFVPMTGSIREH